MRKIPQQQVKPEPEKTKRSQEGQNQRRHVTPSGLSRQLLSFAATRCRAIGRQSNPISQRCVTLLPQSARADEHSHGSGSSRRAGRAHEGSAAQVGATMVGFPYRGGAQSPCPTSECRTLAEKARTTLIGRASLLILSGGSAGSHWRNDVLRARLTSGRSRHDVL